MESKQSGKKYVIFAGFGKGFRGILFFFLLLLIIIFSRDSVSVCQSLRVVRVQRVKGIVQHRQKLSLFGRQIIIRYISTCFMAEKSPIKGVSYKRKKSTQQPKDLEIHGEEVEELKYSVKTGLDEVSGAQISEEQNLVVHSTKISVVEKVSFFVQVQVHILLKLLLSSYGLVISLKALSAANAAILAAKIADSSARNSIEVFRLPVMLSLRFSSAGLWSDGWSS
mgnify:CR=1 FL=1